MAAAEVKTLREKMQMRQKMLENALRKEGDHVPGFLVKLWQIRIKQNFGMEVDSDVAEIIVRIVHERSSWKLSRAEKYLTTLFELRGDQKEDAERKAKGIVETIITGRNSHML